MKSQTEKPFLKTGVVHSSTDIQELRSRGCCRVIHEHGNHSALLNDKQAIAPVAGILEIDRIRKGKIRECLLEAIL